MRRTAALALTVVLALAGCGGEDEPGAAGQASPPEAGQLPSGSSSSAGQRVAAELTEWSIEAAPASAKAGTVQFEAANAGEAPHELVILRTETRADALKVEGAEAKEEGENVADEDVAIDSKHVFEVADMKPGHYILLCNLPGHYQQGMYADFEVK